MDVVAPAYLTPVVGPAVCSGHSLAMATHKLLGKVEVLFVQVANGGNNYTLHVHEVMDRLLAPLAQPDKGDAHAGYGFASQSQHIVAHGSAGFRLIFYI